MVANDALRRARLAARLSQGQLAAAVNTATGRETLEGSTISRYERGTIARPRQQVVDAFCAVLQCDETALGFAGRSVSTRETAQDIEGVSSEMELRPIAWTQLDGESAPIDDGYIENLHKEIHDFVQLDQQYGGLAASPVILQAYRQMRHRVNTSEIRKGLYRETFSALAEVAEVAGWSLYDGSTNDVLTAQVNNESLNLARLAGDHSMELFVLQNMAMHAESTGRPRQSINISQLVLEADTLSPRLEALFRLRLARAYGRLQAERESRTELEHARSLFQDGARDTDPYWAWWVNDAQMWWFEGAVRLDLGMKIESIAFLEQSANATPEPRMNFIYRSWELFGYCLNRSWADADRSLRGIMGDVGIYHSRRAEIRLKGAADLIDNGDAPSSVRDLGSALRVKLSNASA